MTKYTYNLFPLPLVIFGYLFIALSLYIASLGIDYADPEDLKDSLVVVLSGLAIGIILVTMKASIIIDKNKESLYKEYRVFWSRLTKERVVIPKDVELVLIKLKKKRGAGYVQAAVRFGYNLSSYDVFFVANRGIVRILNTDLKRAKKIAELIKGEIGVEYEIEEKK